MARSENRHLARNWGRARFDLPLMRPLAWHVTMRLSDDRVIAPSVRARRLATSTLLDLACGSTLLGVKARVEGVELLAFHIVDTHIHLLAVGARAGVIDLSWRCALALHRRIGPLPVFEPARARPVVDRRHLLSCFWYVHRQHLHHGTGASLDASSALDLLGLRARTDRIACAVYEHLPRLDRAAFAEELGLTSGPFFPDVRSLAEAACAALGVTSCDGRSKEPVLARLGAVHAARAHYAVPAIAEALDLDPCNVRRLAARPAPPALVHAVRAQWSLVGRPSLLLCGDGRA